MNGYGFTFPGMWLDEQDHIWAHETKNMFREICGAYIDAALCYELHLEADADRKTLQQSIHKDSGLDPVPKELVLKMRLVHIHSESSIFYLDRVGKLLNTLFSDGKLSPMTQALKEEMKSLFADIKDLRNSSAHFEERIQGKSWGKQINPQGGIMFIGTKVGSQMVSTNHKGEHKSISQTESSLISIQAYIQRIIDSFKWKGTPEKFFS